MSNFDPTTPYYEQDRIKKKATPLDDLMKEVFTYIRISNPKAFYGWGDEAYLEAASVIESVGLGVDRLRQALQRMKTSSDVPSFPLYKSLVKQLESELNGGPTQYKAKPNPNDWREKERCVNERHRQRVAGARGLTGSDVKTYWMKHIKADLESGGGLFKKVR